MFLELQFAVGYGLVNTVVCIVFGSKWVTYFQLFQSRWNSRELMCFWHMKVKLPSEFTGDYWICVVKILWLYILAVMTQLRNNGMMAEIWTWMTSCGLVVLSPQHIIWTGKKLTDISENCSSKFKHRFSYCEWAYCRFRFQNCALWGCHISLCLKWREQNWNRVSIYSLTTKARVTYLSVALS